MFIYAKNYEESKTQLFTKIKGLKKKGYHIFTSKHVIVDDLAIDKVIIKARRETLSRLILNIGLHGIEGYVGHSCIMTFIDELLPTLNDNTEVILYHPLNPYGMKNYRRTNENNVDLNRNFSSNNFASENPGYDKIKNFFTPKRYKGKKSANLSFYLSVAKLVTKYGTSTLKEATLLGQKTLNTGVYFSSNEYQNSTRYILKEIKENLKDIKKVIWVDLHTGYGKRYQMSIVNSKYEKDSTRDFITNINYPLVLGLNGEDFYEIDGDMIETIYSTNNKLSKPVDLFATCFEFGTLGEPILKSIESLKAMIFENSSHFINQNPKFKSYSDKLIREQFLPSEEKWRIKAYQDFKQALSGILKYKNLVK